MKPGLLLFFCLLIASVRAQLVVVAPDVTSSVISANSAQLAQWATAIAKYEEQIQQQLQQIEKAKELLNVQNTLLIRVGDWQQVAARAKAIQLQAKNLTADFGVNWKQTTLIDSGDKSLVFTAHGIFNPINGLTDQGVKVVSEKRLRKFTVLENMYDDVNATFDQTEEVRKKILQEIADTAADLGTVKTQAEADVLRARLEGLKAALANVQAQRDEKMQRLLVQQAINVSQKEKEDMLKETREAQNSADQVKALGKIATGGSSFR